MRSMEFTGKTVDEAVFNGLKAMELSIDEVIIETLRTETKGVFGICAKRACVRLTEKEPEAFDFEELKADWKPRPEQKKHTERKERRQPKQRQPRPEPERKADSPSARETEKAAPVEAKPQKLDEAVPAQAPAVSEEKAEARPTARPERPERRNQQSHRPRQPRHGGQRKRNYEPREYREPEYKYSEELALEQPAAQFLSGLLTRMGVEARVLAAQTEEGLHLKIDGKAMGVLIGHRGATLDSLQYLTSLVANKKREDGSYLRVSLDTEDYRFKREETLKRLARHQAQRVRETGRSVNLEPMKPYERRILHATLQNNPYVTTYSEGEEPNRYVVIAPRTNKAE